MESTSVGRSVSSSSSSNGGCAIIIFLMIVLFSQGCRPELLKDINRIANSLEIISGQVDLPLEMETIE